MSAEHPETLKEWEAFRFPVRERSSLEEAARQQAVANGEVAEELPPNEDEDGGADEGSGQGSLALFPPETLPDVPPVSEETPVPVREQTLPPVVETPLHDGPPVAKPEQGIEELPPAPPVVADTVIEAPMPAAPIEEPPVVGVEMAGIEPTSLPVPPPPPPSPPVAAKPGKAIENSWSYDPARGVLINWHIEKSLILNKMDRLSKIPAYIREVEKNDIDRPGFERALDLACQDIHHMTLERLLATWDTNKPLTWGDTLAPEHLPIQRVRRARHSH